MRYLIFNLQKYNHLMKKLLLLLSFTLIALFGYSQALLILDEDSKNPIAGITVKYHNQALNSDKKGMVALQGIQENELIELESKFYQSKSIRWNHALKEITLKKITKTIQETQIIGKRPTVKVEAGKTVLDASQATIQQGTLKDMIQQIPGVIIDNNSNISVKGKTGLRILVDGKTSQIALSDMKTFLESIPAQSIKSIEVLTNPGAQYDAQGKSGIISIKLKKDKREGFNTKLSAGVGSVFNKYNLGIFSNYKNEKFNLFGNYQFNYRDQWYGYSEDRVSSINNTQQYYNYIASWENIARTHNGKAGIDYFINDHATISYTFDRNSSFNTGNNYHDNTSEVYDASHNLVNSYLAYNLGRNNIHTTSNGLSFRKTYDSSQAEWSIDIAHTYFSEDNTNVNENYAYNAVGNPLYNQYYYFEPVLNNSVHNIMAKTDVSLPTSFAKLEFGLKNEANFNRNNYLAYLKDYNTPKYTSSTYQNNFEYNDNIFAGYIQGSKSIGIVQLDLGIRAENTVISSNNPDVARQYLNWFPNVGLSSPLDSHTNLSLRYSKRIQRPSFNQLNNRIVYYNRYTANVGVPTLQPEIADIFSAQLDRNFMDGQLNLSLGVDYNIESNDISEINFIDTTYTSYFTYGNVGSANLLSTYLNIYYKPSKWLDVNLTPQYLYSHYQSVIRGIDNISKGSSFQFSAQVNSYLPAGIKLSANGWMTSQMIWAQGYSDLFGLINLSASKSFFKNKLNVEVSCSDILNSNIWTGYQTTGNIRSRGVWKPETRIAWLNLEYNLGKKINYRRKEIGKSDRIKATGR